MEKKISYRKISFVILSWNSEKYLKDCIESIMNLKNVLYEIFLVDNGSVDKSIDIIKSFNEKNINLIKLEKNYGTTISRNKALHLISQTDFICILDSDTIINEKAMQIMMKYLMEHSDVGIVGPTMYNAKNEKQISYRKFPNWKLKIYKALPFKFFNNLGEKNEHYDETQITNEFECDYLISACWLMKLSTYKKLGDFDEKIFYAPEDVEYCMRAKVNGLKIVYLRDAEIIHYYQRISKKKFISKANITHIKGLAYIFKKYKNINKLKEKN